MAKIGIMGGTFNPIHNGHLHIAEAAYKEYHLDEIYFMPNHIPAYKSRAEMISVNNRIEMVALAIEDFPHFTLNTMEIDRGGKTYTADTLRILCRQKPKNQYYFILGADSLETFPRWYHPQEITACAEILVAAREATDDTALAAIIAHIEETLQVTQRFHILHCNTHMDTEDTAWISSSQIRHCIAMGWDIEPVSGRPVEQLLPETVYSYIIEHHLYG